MYESFNKLARKKYLLLHNKVNCCTMVLNLSSPFFNFLSGILMSTIQIVTSEKKIAGELI